MCSETFLELECFLWRIAELRLSRNQYSACRFFLNRFLLSFFLLDTSYFLTRVTREHPATWDSWHSVSQRQALFAQVLSASRQGHESLIGKWKTGKLGPVSVISSWLWDLLQPFTLSLQRYLPTSSISIVCSWKIEAVSVLPPMLFCSSSFIVFWIIQSVTSQRYFC